MHRLIRGNRTVLCRDVRANEIRVLQKCLIFGTSEEAGEEHCEERVAGADGVAHLDLESRVLGPSVVAPEGGTVSATRDADRAAVELVRQSGDCLLEIPTETEPRCEPVQLTFIQLHHVGAA